MPNWKSDRGVWTPKKEKTYVDYTQSRVDSNRGKESHMYEGPDRAAKDVLKEKDVEYLGGDVTQDPDLIMRAKQMDKTVEEYLHLHDSPTAKQKAAEEAKKNEVVTHQPQKPKPGVSTGDGGVVDGGFGEVPA